MRMLNNKGDRMAPCGTPVEIGYFWEYELFTFTVKFLLERKSVIQRNILPLIPLLNNE